MVGRSIGKGDGPGFAYYTTMPTDALQLFRDAAVETQKIGWKKVEERFEAQGKKVYDLLEKFGLKILAAKAVRAPGVVVAGRVRALRWFGNTL